MNEPAAAPAAEPTYTARRPPFDWRVLLAMAAMMLAVALVMGAVLPEQRDAGLAHVRGLAEGAYHWGEGVSERGYVALQHARKDAGYAGPGDPLNF
jgi:hypothetical protein